MANNKSIQILRGSTTYDPFTSEEVLLDGQPFYSKKTNKLYIGDGTQKISELKYIGQEINERIIKDPSKTYLVWKGNEFPNSDDAQFKAPAGCTIDWGDGNVETFETASQNVNKHTYSDGVEYHLISLSSTDPDIFFGDNAFNGCTKLWGITIPDAGVTSIGNYAFKNCKFTSVTIPSGVTSIGEGAFYNCTRLTSITIPNNVTSIGREAFWECGLARVIIGSGVMSIGNYAFRDSYQGFRGTVEILATDPPTLGPKGALDSILSVFNSGIEKIIVPKSAINTYKSASGWSDYADKIVYETDSSEYENTFWLSGGEAISSTEKVKADLNSYIKIGNYYCELNNYAETVLNFPAFIEKQAFTLKVFCGNGMSYITQRIRTYASMEEAERYAEHINGKWEWRPWALVSKKSYQMVTRYISTFDDFMTDTEIEVEVEGKKEHKTIKALREEFKGLVTPFLTRNEIALGDSGFKLNPWSFGFIQGYGQTGVQGSTVDLVIYAVSSTATQSFFCNQGQWTTEGPDIPGGFTSRLISALNQNNDRWPLNHSDFGDDKGSLITDWRWTSNNANGDVAFVGTTPASEDTRVNMVLDGTLYVNEGRNKVVTDGGSSNDSNYSGIGSNTKPVYLNSNNAIVASNETVGENTKDNVQPIYMKEGSLTTLTENVGSDDTANHLAKPIYMNGGKLQPISSTIGSSSKPIYMNNGTLTACTYGIDVTDVLPSEPQADTIYFITEG